MNLFDTELHIFLSGCFSMQLYYNSKYEILFFLIFYPNLSVVKEVKKPEFQNLRDLRKKK